MVGVAAPLIDTQVAASFKLSIVLPLIVEVLAPVKITPALLKLRIVLLFIVKVAPLGTSTPFTAHSISALAIVTFDPFRTRTPPHDPRVGVALPDVNAA
jgi:hypothetical protein